MTDQQLVETINQRKIYHRQQMTRQMQISDTTMDVIANHPWHDKPAKTMKTLSTSALLNVYGILMSTLKAQSRLIKATSLDEQQYFSPDLKSTLETYVNLLESGVIVISERYWPALLTLTESSALDAIHLKNAIFELNIEPRLPNSRVCAVIKKEIIERIRAGKSIALVGMECWHLLNQAYCFNAIAYRYQTFGIDASEHEFTTAEYLDITVLSTKLSIGWIHTLCHRAFNWCAGKQKETGMSDAKAAKLAIGSVIRQFTWATESTPLGEMYTRPKSLVVFGLERVFSDIFDIRPEILYSIPPDVDYLQHCLNEKYSVPAGD